MNLIICLNLVFLSVLYFIHRKAVLGTRQPIMDDDEGKFIEMTEDIAALEPTIGGIRAVRRRRQSEKAPAIDSTMT